MKYKQTHALRKTESYEMLYNPLEVVGADIVTVKNNTFLCIVDYYGQILVVKKDDSLSADNLINSVKIVFAEFGLPEKIVSDAVTNFISDNVRQLCRQLNIEQTITTSYNH